ncbi:hypothetical protein K6118_03530 [Kordiimonas sp. A6E486]|nr:hypothetical protein [Kordiimonas marina]
MTVSFISLDSAERIKRPFGEVYYFPIADGLPDLPIFSEVIDLFAFRRRKAPVPQKTSFNFRDLRGWHARFSLTKFNDDYSDGQIRILGEDYKMLFGGALKQGMSMSDTDNEKLPGLVQYFGQLLTRPAIGYFTGSLPEMGREHVKADILDFPATDAEGRNRFILSFIRERVR